MLASIRKNGLSEKTLNDFGTRIETESRKAAAEGLIPAHFSRDLVLLRLRLLVEKGLVKDIRAGPKGPGLHRRKTVSREDARANPFFKIHHQYGNAGLIGKYKELKESGDKKGMQQIQSLIVLVNPNKPKENALGMLEKPRRV